MKTRLGIFIAALLLLPLAGLYLSGNQWSELLVNASENSNSVTATLRTTILLLLYALLANHIIKRISGNGPFDIQRNYFLTMSVASALLGWLLSYLNHFVDSWTVVQDNSAVIQIMIYTPLFALLAPAVLITRALLASFPGLLKFLTCRLTFPEINGETVARMLLAVAVFGLLGGAAWPEHLYGLFWAAPLLLLVAMQLLWHESTIFSRLKSGDWGRVVCTALSGMFIGNLAVVSYQTNAPLDINLPSLLIAQAGLALFGLLCLQLGDVIAENWRGKSRITQFQEKKKFPIPVVVRKN